LGSIDSGANINDLAIGHSDQNAFLATSHATQEFQVIEISTPTAPTLLSAFDAADVTLGVGYNSSRDWAVAVGQANNQEFVVYGPQ
jgi:hypothetical protein